MPKTNEDLTKHTLMLFTGDYGRIQELHPEISAAKVIRSIIRAYVKKIDPAINTDAIKGDHLDV